MFRAFAQQEEQSFSNIAESIIKDVSAGNNHSLATQLQKALDTGNLQKRSSHGKHSLLALPTDRRNGDSLISIQESHIATDQIFLHSLTEKQIQRLFAEQHHKLKLAEHGYAPKNKLLFWGPPGCGKSYTAAYIAHELGMLLGTVQISTLISSFLGDTASHIQKIFDTAEKTPLVLFFDEVDSIAKQRDDPNDVGELKRVVNSLLQAMDSFRSTKSIIIAASNHQYLLDPAIWRRFDDIVQFPIPSKTECERYVHYLLNGVSTQGTFEKAIKSLSGMSFADIKRVVIETIKTALLQGTTEIALEDISVQAGVIKKIFNDAVKTSSKPKSSNK
ncbi:MAG: ATP-binding protein [Planctomycetaceae bacterium]|nr:ATP-binding protein [Planctomycetaceae bacterium]